MMTESEWLASTEPEPMLEFLRDKASDRKLRLFGCACCWRLKRWLFDERSRFIIEVTEQFVDGLVSDEAYRVASNDAYLPIGSPRQHADAGHNVCLWYAARAVTEGGKKNACDIAQFAAHASAAAFATAHLTWNDRRWDRVLSAAFTDIYGHGPNIEIWEDVAKSDATYQLPWSSFQTFPAWDTERRYQADLLRHVIGNPFHSYTFPAHLPAHVVQLAEALYQGEACAFALHDALLEAGHADFAEHFSVEQSHPRGCWVLDAILGRR